ncbi:MAG: amidase [Actinomycetota bacterium]|nr:amidase [Actinomycetota bacterium]
MSSLCFATAKDLVTAIRDREVSVREVVEDHLNQIDRVNPSVNAVVTLVGEQALAAAATADARSARGEDTGPLHGLPIVHKDTHETAGIRTTHGSPVLSDHVPGRDELLVERLRSAGTIALGKSNVPEFAAGSHTFNPVFGVTRNPYDLSRSAGGSSGGAAAALACGMTPLADGSDMGGSLRNPAAFCNVVGLRPSPGRVPTWPAPAAWATMGVQGPMARTVSDAALLLSAIAGPDPRSPIALQNPGSDFAVPLERDLAGLRVAWSSDFGGALPVERAVVHALEPQLRVFADLGCKVEEACPDFSGAEEVFRTLRAWQFDLALGGVVDRHRDLVKQSVVWNVEIGRALTGPDIGRAETLHTRLFHRLREFFEQYDVLLLPVSQVVPFDADLEYPASVAGVRQETYLDWMRSAYWVSATGCPALSVPGGFTDEGLPVGLQVVGPHRADLRVLQVGHAFEQATRFWLRRPALVAEPEAGPGSRPIFGSA